MELSGALSNPLVLDEGKLRALSSLCHKILSSQRAKPREPRVLNPRPGVVANTVYLVLSDRGTSMRAKEIQRACEIRLGRPVSWNAVKAHLSKHSRGPKSKYLRVGYGRYVCRPKPYPAL